MAQATGLSSLSMRAAREAELGTNHLIWQVLGDDWDPSNNPQGFVSLAVAENRLMHHELLEFLGRSFRIKDLDLTYGGGPTGSLRLRRVLARFLNRHFVPSITLEASHMCITNGVSHAIEQVSWILADRDEAFLLGKPFYSTLVTDVSLRPEVKLVEVSFGSLDPMSIEAVACYDDAILDARKRGIIVKGLIMCSPHNPLGRCYSREVLIECLKLCQKHSIHLVIDEIYGLSVWENQEDADPAPVPFTSVLSLDLSNLIDASLVHVLWGMSKDFGANGMRVGCIISQSNRALHEALKSFAVYSWISSISDQAVVNILEDDNFTDYYMEENRKRLSAAYSYAVNILRKNGIPYSAGFNAGFFLWIDLGEPYIKKHPTFSGNLTEEIMQALLKQKLYLATGAEYGSEKPGTFRVVFTHPKEYLDEGLSRMMKAIEAGDEDV